MLRLKHLAILFLSRFKTMIESHHQILYASAILMAS